MKNLFKEKNIKIENMCRKCLSSNLGRFWTEFFSSFCPSFLQPLKNSHKDKNRIVGGVFRLQKKTLLESYTNLNPGNKTTEKQTKKKHL